MRLPVLLRVAPSAKTCAPLPITRHCDSDSWKKYYGSTNRNAQNQINIKMIIYNVTASVDIDVHEAWLAYMRLTHVPDVMSTGMFVSYRLTKMLAHEHEDMEIYAIQYLCKDLETLQKYQAEFAPALQADVKRLYDGKFTVFRSYLEVLEHNEQI
jgi:Domain of unknown function (DUF4286)